MAKNNYIEKQPTESDIALMDFFYKRYGCKWFEKKKDGECIAYTTKPKKSAVWWKPTYLKYGSVIHDLSHLSWEDKEPYEYKPKIELKIGDEVWRMLYGKPFSSKITQLTIMSDDTLVFCEGNIGFNKSCLNSTYFLTKKECEENYVKKQLR